MDCEEILRQLSLLQSREGSLRLFGASSHRYDLNPVLSDAEVRKFEEKHQVELPSDYREFLLRCGNGGAGPYYGLFLLGLFDGSGSGLVPWHEGDGFAGVLREPFPHRAAWNLPSEQSEPPDEFPDESAEERWHRDLDELYWAPHLTSGAFPICHQGCAYRNLLVVSGPERGHIWLDGRASGEGIAPVEDHGGERVTFSAWYGAWLDAALDGKDFV
jgi:hypothetical protein